jgi:predicted benzoate:H+ symporter BenE
MALWGFGAAFWALVIGMVVTLLLEPNELAAARQAASGTA